tara:strand:+ start:1810 stop:2055 length:246 start_codon:yes stop_codon:yes gene_type:complete
MKATRHQIIWHRETNSNGWHAEDAALELRMPKIINSDIGFQLQFGPHEDIRLERHKTTEHHEKQQKEFTTITDTTDPIKWI